MDKLLEPEYFNVIRNTIISSVPKVNESDIDDLIQDVYLDILKKEKTVEKHPDIHGWLCNATKFVIKRYWRSKVAEFVFVGFTEDIKDPTNYEEAVESNDYVKRLLEYIPTQLNFAEREIWELKCLKRLSNYVIAEKLGVKRTAVDARVTRLRKKLKNVIKKFEQLSNFS